MGYGAVGPMVSLGHVSIFIFYFLFYFFLIKKIKK